MKAVILNAGSAAWAFEERAQRLSRVMGLEVSETPADRNYLLAWDDPEPPSGESFIPIEAIECASDKRRLAKVFAEAGVVTPITHLLDSADEVKRLLEREAQSQWVLKWPTGCGAAGHRLQEADMPIPPDWPRPYVLQEFIRLDNPEVYRLYCVVGEMFGWNARRFPPDAPKSPFVAHARGARYEDAGEAPSEAQLQAQRALSATNLLDSFGCVDLLRDENGRWFVLEVNTDGISSHVDRDIALRNLAAEIDERIARAFHDWRSRDALQADPHGTVPA